MKDGTDLRLAGFDDRAQLRVGFRRATLLTGVFVIAYLLVGLTGHDPWKQDETYIFGIVQSMLESGDWVVPMMAGDPFMEKPPLYYWVATFFARGFSPWLPLHDAARLATGFFMGITLTVLGWTSHRLWGPKAGNAAVLMLIACLGTALYAHLMVTDIPVMTGMAFAAAGFTLVHRRAELAGCLLGIGVGVGFLGKGLLLPGVIGVTAVLLPTLFRTWRTPAYMRACGIAALVSLPALIVWPAALYQRSPTLFHEWFWMNNVGRFLGFSVEQLGAANRPGYWMQAIVWFSFPALPLALLTVWNRRSRLRQDVALQGLATCCIVFMATLIASASARESYALPLLVPLSLLAAPSVMRLPVRIDRIWTQASCVIFGAVAAFLWSVWVMAFVGAPPTWRWLDQYILVDPATASLGRAWALAVTLTVVAVGSAAMLVRSRGSGLVTWVAGLSLCWGLAMSLWLPWIEASKSYRDVLLSMSRALPPVSGCLSSIGLGESERAMLKYVVGITTRRYEIVGYQGCRLLLIEGLAVAPAAIDPAAWKLLWQGAREHDTRERFWLYARAR